MYVYRSVHKYECYFCKRHTSDVVFAYIDGDKKVVCQKCFLAYILHETIKSVFKHGNEDELRYLVRVLKGINDLVEDNPQAQAIRTVIDKWAQKYPQPLYLDELVADWHYKVSLDAVLDTLSTEGILVRARLSGLDRVVLSPGETLRELLKRFPTSKGLFSEVVKAVTGLAVVGYIADAKNPKFRALYATLQAILACIEDSEKELVYKEKGYRCKLCGNIYATKAELKSHIFKEHGHKIMCGDEECLRDYIEVVYEDRDREIGVLCRLEHFIAKAGVYGVENIDKFFRSLVTKGAVVPREGNEIVVERDGKKYVVVDIAWAKIRELMRTLERQIVRTR